MFFLINSANYAQDTIHHKVSKGESLSLIAKKYNIKQKEIYSLNPKAEGKILKLNSILLIPNHQYKDSIFTVNKIDPISFEKTAIVIDSISTVLEPSIADQLINVALQNLGTKYIRGGTNTKGFDCSGLLFSTFKELNLNLPRTSFAQAQTGTKIEPIEAKKGDLIFFATNKKGIINHVGIITEIIGDEIKFIHSSLHLGVTISSTKESYYAKRLKQINNVLNNLF
tara:strand:+ start:805 stop:1482 length:678 start_codon:yes stop_codon:yes gene_type:complete